jgi:hypothetical protein
MNIYVIMEEWRLISTLRLKGVYDEMILLCLHSFGHFRFFKGTVARDYFHTFYIFNMTSKDFENFCCGQNQQLGAKTSFFCVHTYSRSAQKVFVVFRVKIAKVVKS